MGGPRRTGGSGRAGIPGRRAHVSPRAVLEGTSYSVQLHSGELMARASGGPQGWAQKLPGALRRRATCVLDYIVSLNSRLSEPQKVSFSGERIFAGVISSAKMRSDRSWRGTRRRAPS